MMKHLVKKHKRGARAIAIVLAILLAVVAAVPMYAPRPALAAGTTLVSNWTELQAALTNSATTSIVFTADITIGAGTQLNTAMADGLVIDGKDPVTGQIHTLTETPSNSNTGNLYISANGTLKKVTVQNLNIDGKDYWGFLFVNDNARGIDLVYDNVTYIGPQMTYNRYGSATFRNCDFTITQNGAPNAAEELVEAAQVVFEGMVTANSSTTAHAIVRSDYNYNNTTPGNIEIKPGAIVDITAPAATFGFLYNNIAANILIIGGGATFNFNGIAWSTRTDIAAITIGDGTAAQPTTVNIKEPDSTGTSSTDLFRAAQTITIGNYCNVFVAGLPSQFDNGIYAGTALNIGDNSNLEVNINTAGGTGSFSGDAVYVANASTSTGITVGANSTVTATINGTNAGSTGAISTMSTGANSGIHLNGPNSSLSVNITGASSTYSIYAAGGDIFVGPNSTMKTTFGGAVSNWAVNAPSTTGTFKLGQGAALLIDDRNAGTSTNGGLSVSSNTGIQMADSASLKGYFTGFNNNSSTSGAGSMVYVPYGALTAGQNCTIEVKMTGVNTAVYAGINARGISLGTGTSLTVDLNATTSTNLIYANGNVTVGAGANLYLHTAKNVTTCQYLLDMVAGSFTVNQGATVYIIAEDSTLNYPNVNLTSSGAVFNSPKSVVVYTSSGRQAFWSPGATFAVNNVQQINLWHAPITLPPAMTSGRFDSLPTFNWRSSTSPNDGIVGAVSMSGSVATGTNASFTSMTAPGVVNTPALATDQTTTGPTITNAYLGGSGATRTAALAFGYLPLTASTDSAVNPGAVVGATDPGSVVVLAAWDGTKYVPVGTPATADAQGNYSIDTKTFGLGPNQNYQVISSSATNYLTTKIAVTFYQVTFDANGGQNDPSVSDPLFVVAGTTISAPPAPTNGPKNFGGWFTDPALTQPFAFDTTPITADTTLYAKWVTTTVVIRETVVGVSGAPATNEDYMLAGLNSSQNIAFELVFTSQKTGAVYNVLAWRDRPVTLDALPAGESFTVQARRVQHLRPDSIVLVSATNGGSFTAQSLTSGTLSLSAGSTVELNFVHRIAPAGFGNAQSASNLYKVKGAN